jgi:hypothetical protein
VDNIKIRRIGWAGHIIKMKDENIPPPKKKALNGEFHYTGSVENQKQDRGTFSRGMQCRFWEYNDRRASLGYRRMEALFEGGQSPEGAVAPCMDGWTDFFRIIGPI